MTDKYDSPFCTPQERFLPDKAIDLVDEACSSVRVQLDSRPEEIDQLERHKMTLQVGQAGPAAVDVQHIAWW